MSESRPSWEEYALLLAETAKLRSEDPYLKVGACALRFDHSVAALGYNGAPPGINISWKDRDERRKRVIHAELSTLKWVKPGECGLIAVTIAPCPACVILIASYQIPQIVYIDEYKQDKERLAFQLCKEFKINIKKIAIN